MDEEDLVKDRLRSKQKEEEQIKRFKQDEKKRSELTRAEKNKEWRMKKGQERSELNWRKIEANVRTELNCPSCRVEMAPPWRIFQCRDGHVICEECWNQADPKVIYVI